MNYTISNSYKNGVNFEHWLTDILGLSHEDRELLAQKNTFSFTAFNEQQEFTGSLIFKAENETVWDSSLLLSIPTMGAWLQLVGDTEFDKKLTKNITKNLQTDGVSKKELVNQVANNLKIKVGLALLKTHKHNHTLILYFQSAAYPELNYCSVNKGLKGDIKKLAQVLTPEICPTESFIDFLYSDEVNGMDFKEKQVFVLKDLINTGLGLPDRSHNGIMFDRNDAGQYCAATAYYQFFGYIFLAKFTVNQPDFALGEDMEIELKSYYPRIKDRGMLLRKEIFAVMNQHEDQIRATVSNTLKEFNQKEAPAI